MPFKRLQARGIPLLRPFKKIGLAACVAGGFRAVFSPILPLLCTNPPLKTNLYLWCTGRSHTRIGDARVPADCSQLPGLRRVYREPPGP